MRSAHGIPESALRDKSDVQVRRIPERPSHQAAKKDNAAEALGIAALQPLPNSFNVGEEFLPVLIEAEPE
jgi:hypothetical protein